MSPLVGIALVVALASALAAVVLGQVLTRSVLAGHAAMAALGLACLAAGGGVLALCFVLFGLVWLAILQLFGWMLVDVDRDHLPSPAWRTTAARLAALAVFAAGLGLLGRRALRSGQLDDRLAPGEPGVSIDPSALGAVFLGAGNELALLVGLLLAAGLLTALWLLRDEGSEAG
ncbi:MAG: hypothetical protein U0900_21135 [Myxococcota bacterium]